MTDNHLPVALDLTISSLMEGRQLSLRVSGESMMPLLRDGDRVWVERQQAELLYPGDLVVIKVDHELITHRLVASRRGYWITKGDHAVHMDPMQEPGNILGCVLAVDMPGKRLDLNRKSWKIVNRWLAGISYMEARASQWLERQANLRPGTETPKWLKFAFRLIRLFTRLPVELVKYAWR